MDKKIIDGKSLAKKHEDILKEKLSSFGERKPTLVSFCNRDDSSAVKYTQLKKQKAEDLKIVFIVEEYDGKTYEDNLVNRLNKYASDPEIDGILIQLPLPDSLKPSKVNLINLIPPEKDVDGLTGKSFLPATVKGIISILDSLSRHPAREAGRIPLDSGSNNDEMPKQVWHDGWKNKKVAVVGATGEVGGEMILALKKMRLKPLEISRRADNFKELKKAQIIISATGQESLIKSKMIKEGAILIDVGLGDFDTECYKKANKYTPITGGVGPMTVISLMENVVESYERRV